jgi:omega-6 fatty acid desaturase (delta-12 desaturase)
MDAKALAELTQPFRKRDRRKELRLFLEMVALLALVWGSVLCLHSPTLALAAGTCAGALLYVRLYSMFHEHAHGVFLDHASPAGLALRWMAKGLMLTDLRLWQKGHNRHHDEVGHFGVLLPGAIGLVNVATYRRLSPPHRALYHLFRNPIFLFVLAYFSIFIGYFNLTPLGSSRRYRWNGLFSLTCHFGLALLVGKLAGPIYGFALVILPAMVGAPLGVLVFYLQHIFPSANYDVPFNASLQERIWASSSVFSGPRVVLWCLGDQEHHHLHHLDPAIPFYRRKEACAKTPQLNSAQVVRLSFHHVYQALNCFLWDSEQHRFISKKQLMESLGGTSA